MNRNSLTLLLALTVILTCQSCLVTSRVEAPVREEPDRFVRVEARYGDPDRGGVPRFNHPLVLSEKEWIRLLENVWVRHEPGALALVSPQEPSVPAFTSDEIVFLGKWLNKAFNYAHSDEWVVFGLSRRRSPELMELTSGGWFVGGTRLYLRLANYRHAVTMLSVRKRLWDDPLQSMGDRYYSFAVGDYQSAGLVGGGPMGDIRGTSLPQLAIDYSGLLKLTSDAQPAQKSEIPQPAISSEQGAGTDTAKKLRDLKQMRDEGIITEEDYRTKKKQLLDRY